MLRVWICQPSEGFVACPWARTFKACSFGTPGASRNEWWDNERGSVLVDKGAPEKEAVASGRGDNGEDGTGMF